MAYALQIPLYGVMTMDSLARNVSYTDRTICTVIDAQKKTCLCGYLSIRRSRTSGARKSHLL